MSGRLTPWPNGLVVDDDIAGEFAPAINSLNDSEQVPPWCSYVLMADEVPVAMGGFESAPTDEGSVELGYLTFAPFRGLGHATQLAQGLIDIAHDQGIRSVTAQTLPQANASTRILEKCGFVRDGEAVDDDIGTAWAWRLEL